MKLLKLGLSISAIAVLSTSAFSADSLTKAFKNGKFDGALKSIYYDVDKATKGRESIVSLGVMLNYVTDPFYNMSLGIRAQGSSSPWASAKEKTFYKADLYGPGAVLEEVYLKYQLNKTSLKAGRQYIKTPLLAGNGSRIVHESFQGYTADIKDIPKTRIFVGYIDKYLTRTDFLEGNSKTQIGNFGKNMFMYGKKYAYTLGDGIWTALVVNKSVKGLKLTGQYLQVKNTTVAATGASVGDISVALVQADYRLPISKYNIFAGVQYGTSNVDKDDSRSGDLLGFKLGTKYKGLMASLGYVMDNNDKGMVSGVGISSNWAYAGDIVGLENYNKDVDTVSLNLKYNFAKTGIKGLMMLGRYTQYMSGSSSTLNGGKDLNAYDFLVKYAFNSTLKGLSTKFHYENVAFNSGNVKNYRLYVNYKF